MAKKKDIPEQFEIPTSKLATILKFKDKFSEKKVNCVQTEKD